MNNLNGVVYRGFFENPPESKEGKGATLSFFALVYLLYFWQTECIASLLCGLLLTGVINMDGPTFTSKLNKSACGANRDNALLRRPVPEA